VEKHSELEARLEVQKNDAATCQQQLDIVNEQYENAHAQYDDEVASYENKKKEINDEIGTFQLVIQMYKDSVEETGSQYRGKIEDYLSDGKFDSTYETRELDNFKSIRK